jgi:hypothetical protein
MSDLVFGVGAGTFVLFFFAVALFFVVLLSIPCSKADKIFYRGLGLILYLILLLLLVFANVEPESGTSQDAEKVFYDQSIVARITVPSIAMFVGIFAIVELIRYWGQSKDLSNMEHDVRELWQN